MTSSCMSPTDTTAGRSSHRPHTCRCQDNKWASNHRRRQLRTGPARTILRTTVQSLCDYTKQVRASALLDRSPIASFTKAPVAAGPHSAITIGFADLLKENGRWGLGIIDIRNAIGRRATHPPRACFARGAATTHSTRTVVGIVALENTRVLGRAAQRRHAMGVAIHAPIYCKATDLFRRRARGIPASNGDWLFWTVGPL
jgi:hypothetical protein